MNGQADSNRQSNFIGNYQIRRVKNADNIWMSSVSLMKTHAHHVLKSFNSLNNKQSLGVSEGLFIVQIGSRGRRQLNRRHTSPVSINQSEPNLSTRTA